MCFLTACNSSKSVYEILIGVVKEVDVENKKILVISGLKKEDLHEDYKVLIELKKYKEVLWVTGNDPSRFTIGEEVEISFNSIEDSYPGQVTAKKITKLDH
ncbi:DUF3221 domain-containing protein [Paenibacillus sp. NPDC093718]|uniref:DUF3221 domain-containing protein n=1 Tax=Paenibacillus sp. NPDC093718 TaxID=3390601 RepID=UPI003D01006D